MGKQLSGLRTLKSESVDQANPLHSFIGVTDIASVRFSLPAQLLEPTPNLGDLPAQAVNLTHSLIMLRILELPGSPGNICQVGEESEERIDSC